MEYSNYKILKQLSDVFVKDLTKDYGKAVNISEQLNKKSVIQQFIYPNQFYLEVDLIKNEIVWTHNMKAFLKDASNSFTLFDFYKLVPKEIVNCFALFATQSYILLKKTKHDINYNKEFINMKIPIFCPKKDKMIVVQQTAMALKLDEDNNIISHLNHYIILNEEYKQPFEYLPKFPGREEINKELYQMVKPYLFKFKENQTVLLKLYADMQKINIAKAASFLNCSNDNIKYMNKRIIEITAKQGLGQFKTAKQVASYFRKLNWV